MLAQKKALSNNLERAFVVGVTRLELATSRPPV